VRVVGSVDPHAATVRVVREDESGMATHVRGLVERVVGAMGISASVLVEEDDEEILVACAGGDLGVLIGKHGQTIDALQYVANAAVHRRGEGKSVTVDASGYRERRRSTLEGIAIRAADRALGGERVLLEPMTAVERKVV